MNCFRDLLWGSCTIKSHFFFVFFILIYTVDSLFGWFYKHILFWSHCFWFSNLCHHKDPILAIGILQPMMLLLWTVHHLKDPHYSNVECILGDILKMLYAYFHQFVWKPYLILGYSCPIWLFWAKFGPTIDPILVHLIQIFTGVSSNNLMYALVVVSILKNVQ